MNSTTKYFISAFAGLVVSLLFIKGCSVETNEPAPHTQQLKTIDSAVKKQAAQYNKQNDSLINLIVQLNKKLAGKELNYNKGKTAVINTLNQLDTVSVVSDKITACDSLQQQTKAFIQQTDTLLCFLEQKIIVQQEQINLKDTHILNLSGAYIQLFKESAQINKDLISANKKLKRHNRLIKVLGAITLASTTALILNSHATH